MSAIALPVRQGTPQWYEARYQGIGSSEAAAAVDADPRRSPEELVAEKLRLIPPEPENELMRVGKMVEPIIAQLYEEQAGRKVRRVTRLLQHEKYPFVLASLDRASGDRVIELKQRRTSRDWGMPGTDEVPEPVLHQVQQQLAVTGKPLADVAVWVGGADLLVYHVPADRELQELLIDAEADLWGYVQRGELPPASERPERVVRNFAGEREADEEITAMAQRLAELRARLRIDEAEAKEVQANLIAAIGEHRRVKGVDFSLTLLPPSQRRNTAWQKVADGYRLLAQELWAALEMQPGVRPYPLALAEGRPLESLYTTTTDVAASLRCYGRLFEHEEEATQ
jgi:putative phage-type endonuclease